MAHPADDQHHEALEVDLRAREERLRRTLEGIDAIVSFKEDADAPVIVSPQVERILGYPPEMLTTFEAWDTLIHPDDLDRCNAAWSGPDISWELQYRLRRADGGWTWVFDRCRRILHEDGRGPGMFGVAVDITAQHEAADARDRLTEAQRGILEAMAEGIIVHDATGAIILANHRAGTILGVDPDALLGQALHDFTPDVSHEDGTPYALEERLITRALRSGRPQRDVSMRLTRPDGSRGWIRVNTELIRDAGGAIASVVSTFTDVSVERELEEQLRQAQRLEAVGLLAGGIAHDFNNMLAAIRGYSDLALELLPEGEARRDILQVVHAAERATVLTRQLLAFSRRQELTPRVLDPAAVIDGLLPMLARLLGDHIAVTAVHAPDVGCVRVDPGQLEQVIVNLAVNSRDAMPDGGSLEITTSNLLGGEPGDGVDPDAADWVRIRVTDSGCGIEPGVLTRIFEPFFTTKEVGKGTGLGLATVYGIVSASGGRVSVTSTQG
ncbi:MAG: PAS domain S-box protein, partial [Chloroflexota bacterium]